ncbi:MAG: COX15/CtaA family protein [Hylemonella sp.]|nr:COX15/CtaA family protein [Hylemonella sp.]
MPANPAELYDLSPLLSVMLMGLVLAIGPLAWVWLRNRHGSATRRLHALTVLTLFLTFDLILFGAFTRLTDSGLGCPDWPGCYGNASPVGAHAEISAAQQAMPTGPVTHGKAWVEMIHRYLATAVGVLSLVLAVASWMEALSRRRTLGAAVVVSPWWATVTLLWVCIQGAFGALTVTMKLFPAIVTLHLLGGLLLLVLLSVQGVRYAQLHSPRASAPLPLGIRRFVWLGFILLALQVALGGWVSTNYAVLACTEFPMCQGSWWPEMNWPQGFELWRELGLTGEGRNIEFVALTAIHYAHRLAAYLGVPVLAWLAWHLHGQAGWQRTAWTLAGLLLLQFLTGLSNVVLDWPLLAAVMHTGGAAALVLVLTRALAVSGQSAGGAHTRSSVSGLDT